MIPAEGFGALGSVRVGVGRALGAAISRETAAATGAMSKGVYKLSEGGNLSLELLNLRDRGIGGRNRLWGGNFDDSICHICQLGEVGGVGGGEHHPHVGREALKEEFLQERIVRGRS